MTSETAAGESPLGRLDAASSRDPQSLYRLLREMGTVVPIEGIGYFVVGDAEIEAVLRQPKLFSSNVTAGELGNERPLIPLQIDPPDQRKYRKLLNPLFAPQVVLPMEGALVELVNELIDDFADADRIDFATQFSIPFPSQVFLKLFGLPYEELPKFLEMKDGIIRPNYILDLPGNDPAVQEYRRNAATSIYQYFDEILAERTAAPRDDLLSWLLAAEVDGDRLTHNEILDICFLFLVAGLDTVSASLDCFYWHLSEHPELRQQIVDHPERIDALVEELLRWETPVMVVARGATEDVELGGCPIKAGDHVMIVLGSADTDPARFPDAEDVRLDRSSNRHLAFGGGVHRCLGSHLARLELRVALREWHKRLPEYQVEPGADLTFTTGVRSVIGEYPMLLGPRPQ
jgi:cytochrome P450